MNVEAVDRNFSLLQDQLIACLQAQMDLLTFLTHEISFDISINYKRVYSQFTTTAKMAESEYLTTLSSNTLLYSENQNKQRIEIYKNIRKTWSIFHESL